MSASEVRVARDRKSLTVYWLDGSASTYSAQYLRENGRSADVVRERIEGVSPEPSPELDITSVEVVGSYALNIQFSDGYDRGIYPWKYLEALNAELAGIPAVNASPC